MYYMYFVPDTFQMLAKLGADMLGRKSTSKQDKEYSLLYSDNIEQPNDKDEDKKKQEWRNCGRQESYGNSYARRTVLLKLLQ